MTSVLIRREDWDTDTERLDHVKTPEEYCHSKSKELSEETNHANTLILNFKPL